jgi:integrase
MMRNPIAELNLTELTPNKIANYRDERLKEVKPNTVIRELAYISSMINHARREWGLGIINPVAQIKKPPQPQGRKRVLNDAEMSRMLHELEKINPFLKPLCEFALETAMRRGELMSLLWMNISFEKSVAFLPLTKNGDSRYVPLSTKAIKILKLIPRDIIRVFTCSYNDVEVFKADFYPGIGANPLIIFTITATESGTLVFKWLGDDGYAAMNQARITVA